jgi:hypothetical protein
VRRDFKFSNVQLFMQEKEKKEEAKKEVNAYAKYSGIAIQMGVIIGAGAWGGVKLDEYFQIKSQVFTIILTLSSVIIAMYVLLKDFIRKSD